MPDEHIETFECKECGKMSTELSDFPEEAEVRDDHNAIIRHAPEPEEVNEED